MEPQATNPKLPLAHMAMDVVSPPPTAEKAPAPEATKPSEDKPKHESSKKVEHKPARPKQPGTGIGLAIFATIVIVLGLAALATYAYLKTV